MPYCKKCGELGRADKCKKCGTVLHTGPSSISQYFNADRWQSSKYIDRVVKDTEQNLSYTSTTTGTQKKMHGLRKIPSILFEKKCRVTPSTSYSPMSSTCSTSPQPPQSPQSSSSTPLSTSSKQSNECAHCHQQLSGQLVQLTENDEGKKYHWSCLLCYECHQPFQSTVVYLNIRQQIYHPECVTSSPILDRSCSHCKRSILDKYIRVHTSVLHPECFRCTGCQKIIKSASIYCHKDQNQVFCRPCHHIHFPQDQYTITNDAHWKVVPQPRQQFVKSSTSQTSYHDAYSSITTQSPTSSPPQRLLALLNPVHPSELMRAKNLGPKRRSLPQFGAIKVCPGCQSRIASVHDECTGPRAAKWHRQCLVCNSCRKVLDSSAKIHQTPENDLLVPTCTTCLLKRKNVNQKNNSEFMKEWCQA